jgi:energy-coupling factor transporter transmembrane protein EcfT
MARFLLTFLLVSLAVFILGVFLPYWALMILVSILVFFIGARPGTAFLSSGLAFGLTWFLMAIYISMQTGSELPFQVATLMGIKNDNLLWFGTGILGMILGGFSGLTGSLFKRLFEKNYEGVYRRG